MKLLLREATSEDGAAISRIYAPYVTDTPITFEEEVPDAAEMAQRIRDIQAKYPYLVGEIDGQVVGYAYATAFRTRASYRWGIELATYVDKESHRHGIGRALCDALLPLLVAQGFVIAYAVITVPNPPSVKLFEGLGFEQVGLLADCGFKFGAWHDVGIWERRLASPATPIEPILWPEMPRSKPTIMKLAES